VDRIIVNTVEFVDIGSGQVARALKGVKNVPCVNY
jgi:hypothetical protein